ncbi:murein DD-endopeptidase MepM/ murein hydrolase activator NlpD [Sphingomonas naasensis]|uniref:M23 family metallopeptidase n=1 Tax=Sphingomonas naasensis TaxID=1344951 RepID=A0A4S1WLU6_9SPHN|nr:M23 family metallopeptidase [Sphingomonas naasensis]NIJ20081.1 murein DD-endopeptidase MepM/ murein hydrolase activator NlpD [Sphingomonas naasensis]TGX44239.1 M23 family metallopeptidase [Sphingomonas naasensis]
MLRRLTMGVGLLLLLALAAMASMIRIVPGDPAAPVAPAPVQATASAPAAPAGAWTHRLLLVPVQGVQRAQIVDTWGQSRANGARAHQATDIMAPGGTPVIAAAPGTIEKLFYSNGGGGITLYVRSPDRQWSYYYAHLQRYAPGIVEGIEIKAGELLGFVGDTGNAGAGNYHLHFAVSHMQPADNWWQGQPVNPYPLLAGRRTTP